MFEPQENSGSTVLLTNNTMVSNKLLILANPRPSGKWICQHVRVKVPTIGTVWYLPAGWLSHTYLQYSCFQEMDTTSPCSVVLAINVLLGLSAAAMLLFTIAILLKIEHKSKDQISGCKVQKRATLKYFLPALRSQKYPVQALSALLLIHGYLLLQLSTSAVNPVGRAREYDSLNIEGSGLDANTSEASEQKVLPPILPGCSFTYLLLYVNFAVPLIFHSIQESDPVWQKKKLWGFLYSVTLLLSSVKYLSSSITFFVVRFAANQSSHSLLFQGFPEWLWALHVISILSVFLFCFSLKIYVDLSYRVSVTGYSTSNFTMRRKVRLCPSPVGVILSTLLIVTCEVPFVMKLCILFLEETELYIICLFASNIGFCLFCLSGSLIVALRRSCLNKTLTAKQRQAGSGVCLANSFVYQSSPNEGKAKC